MPKKDNQKNKAVFILESQPPHIGEVLAVLSVIDNYDLLYICISSNAIIMPLQHVNKIWQMILNKYKDKVTICSTIYDFRTITFIPDIFKECKLLTISQKIFANLATANFPVELVPSAIGFETVWEAMAYRKGRSYHFLKSKSYLRDIKED